MITTEQCGGINNKNHKFLRPNTFCNLLGLIKKLKIMKKIISTLSIALLVVACNPKKEVKKATNTVAKETVKKDESQKVFLLMLDGLRWQELFSGADSLLINNKKYTKDTTFLKKEFWRGTPTERRTTLMPFIWNTIAKEGQIYGNRNFGNNVNVENTHWFSYPGYSETLCGLADNERINSNDKNNNPNQTILELVNNQPEFKGKVGVFGSWDVFPYIINEKRSGLYINAGYREAKGNNLTDNEKYLNHLQKQAVRPWESVRQDVFTHNYAFEFIKKNKPKLLFISYGETDDFAHDGDYTHYLLAARNTDAMIKELWDYCQSNEFYKGKTTFIITTDHGRGTQPLEEWKSHGQGLKYHGKTYNIKGSDQTWFAVIGANVKEAKGVLKSEGQLYNSQIPATIQKILGVKVLPKNANQKVLPLGS